MIWIDNLLIKEDRQTFDRKNVRIAPKTCPIILLFLPMPMENKLL